MLVIMRQIGEKVEIGGGIIVEVVDVRGDRVRLGFTAPQDVAVHRSELAEQLRREGRDPSKMTGAEIRRPARGG